MQGTRVPAHRADATGPDLREAPSGQFRAVVAFEKPERIWILLVGPHDDKDPNRDVYTELYAILGTEPPNAEGRAKPSCCGEDGQPPAGLGDDLADIIIRSVKQRRTRARAR